MKLHVCSFSSNAAELKPKDRTSLNLLLALKENPRISTFDMSENMWLCDLVRNLEDKDYIETVRSSYPWHKWKVTEAGLAVLETK